MSDDINFVKSKENTSATCISPADFILYIHGYYTIFTHVNYLFCNVQCPLPMP